MSSLYPDPSPYEERAQDITAQELPIVPSIEEGEALLTAENQPEVSAPETTLPPEAQGETNGGPLGCCLGTVVGLLLAFLLFTGLSVLLAGGFVGYVTIPFVLVGAGAGGYFGWKIGKRLYKEYEPPVVKQRVRRGSQPKAKMRSKKI